MVEGTLDETGHAETGSLIGPDLLIAVCVRDHWRKTRASAAGRQRQWSPAVADGSHHRA